jgi:hypothetical protein
MSDEPRTAIDRLTAKLMRAEAAEPICPACGSMATRHEGGYRHLAEPCGCSEADVLESLIAMGAFMAPEPSDSEVCLG